jgi:hypothetical protein
MVLPGWGLALPALDMAQLLFYQEDDACCHCWLMSSVSGSQYKHQDSSPSLSYSNICSKQIPFCLSFKLMVPNFPIPQNLHDSMMHKFHAVAKVFANRLKCYTVTQRSIALYHLIHFGTCVWVCHVGWVTRACQFLGAASTLFGSLAPVIIREWMSTGRSPYTHRNWMTRQCVCLDESMIVLRWANDCACGEITQSSLHMMRACGGQ